MFGFTAEPQFAYTWKTHRASPSPPFEGGEGWVEEGRLAYKQTFPVSMKAPLSPLVPPGEREKLCRLSCDFRSMSPTLSKMLEFDKVGDEVERRSGKEADASGVN